MVARQFSASTEIKYDCDLLAHIFFCDMRVCMWPSLDLIASDRFPSDMIPLSAPIGSEVDCNHTHILTNELIVHTRYNVWLKKKLYEFIS